MGIILETRRIGWREETDDIRNRVFLIPVVTKTM